MIGAGRDVRGGVSSVVNSYYDAGLDKLCGLTYLPTMEDGSKLKKLLVAVMARIRFERMIRKNDILHVHMSSDNSFYRKAVFIRSPAPLRRAVTRRCSRFIRRGTERRSLRPTRRSKTFPTGTEKFGSIPFRSFPTLISARASERNLPTFPLQRLRVFFKNTPVTRSSRSC